MRKKGKEEKRKGEPQVSGEGKRWLVIIHSFPVHEISVLPEWTLSGRLTDPQMRYKKVGGSKCIVRIRGKCKQ